MTGILKTKRIYDPYAEEDGYRILVDRLWPRGMKKENAHMDAWLKSVAPSTVLRKQYHTDNNYALFQKNYERELEQNDDTAALISVVKEHLEKGNVTLLSSSKDIDHCNASVLYEYLSEKI